MNRFEWNREYYCDESGKVFGRASRLHNLYLAVYENSNEVIGKYISEKAAKKAVEEYTKHATTLYIPKLYTYYINCGWKDNYFYNKDGRIIASVYEDKNTNWVAFYNEKSCSLGFYVNKESAKKAIEEYFNTF